MNKKKIIYLDNVSNTKMRKEVRKIYKKIIYNKYISNSSSFHFLGRKSKNIIELARNRISKIINSDPQEIIFTSSGSEGNYIIIKKIIKYYKIKNIITSKLEHFSILNLLNNIKKKINIFYLKNDNLGNINIKDLKFKIKRISKKKKNKILVTLMYINNEIGNINNIKKIGNICKLDNVLFHSDFVQYIGHYPLNIKKIKCDFFTASAHKFYGPLGIGFIYVNKNLYIKNIIKYENIINIKLENKNIYGIVSMSKALEISNKNYKKEKQYILKLKKYCIKNLKKYIKNIKFNGLSYDIKKSIYNILNIRLPIKDDLLHIKLDLKGIIVSKGSSCYSNNNNSYVIKNLLNKKIIKRTTSLRVSFSIYNKKKEIKKFIKILKKLIYKNK
ncbi:MAG: aminotransferase class V-fold PLP-dependent enzyme [Candidatus Shikimatogenerans sp. JK-2022]|nr:aminotransferase class V-fold PLP-dependent enzyme [Candidatus Shikimatogenerans bostrichidophilus]